MEVPLIFTANYYRYYQRKDLVFLVTIIVVLEIPLEMNKSTNLGEKLSKYLIVIPIILSKYKLGIGTKWSDQVVEELHKPIIKKFPLRRIMVSGPN